VSVWRDGEWWGWLGPARGIGLLGVGVRAGRWRRFDAGVLAGFVGRVAPEVRLVVSGWRSGSGRRLRERVEALERGGEIGGPGPAGLYS
jgi:hypothetical protein